MTKFMGLRLVLSLAVATVVGLALQQGAAIAQCHVLTTSEAVKVAGLGVPKVLHMRICTTHYKQLDCNNSNGQAKCSGTGACTSCKPAGGATATYKHCDTTTDPFQDCNTSAGDNVDCGSKVTGTCYFDSTIMKWFCTASGTIGAPCSVGLVDNCH